MEKQLLLMKGMLLGAMADKTLKKEELLFLDLWLKELGQENLDGDLLDLSEQINDVLEDGIFDQEEHADTISLIDNIIEYSEIDSDEYALVVLGYISAICSDGELNHSELLQLNALVDQHIDIPLCKLLKSHLNSDLKEKELLALFNGITGNEFLNTGSISSDACNFMFDKFNGETLKGKKVAITGVTHHLSRDDIKKAITAAGAIVTGSVSSKTDILLVGEEGSDDYTFGSFGRKFERALDEKVKGSAIRIYFVQDIIEPLISNLESLDHWSLVPNDNTTLEDVLFACANVSADNHLEIINPTTDSLRISVFSTENSSSELTIQQLPFGDKKYSLKTQHTNIVTKDKVHAYTAFLSSFC